VLGLWAYQSDITVLAGYLCITIVFNSALRITPVLFSRPGSRFAEHSSAYS